MANKKQSDFPSASSFDGTETFGLIQAGLNKKSLLASIKSFVLQGVNSNVLTGLSLASSSVISAADSIIGSLGKLQGQVTNISNSLSGYSPILVLGKSSVSIDTASTVVEEVLATITIPTGLMTANSQVAITTLWTYTNSSNDKTLRVRLGGLSGISYLTKVVTTTATSQTRTIIRNRSSASSQIGFSANQSSYGDSTNAVVTSSINTNAGTTIVITGEKGLGTETLTLESYSVEVIK